MIEHHPYIDSFDNGKCWSYLIVGTFPPNKKVREERSAFVDYFYGNRGSFWRIVDALYPQYKLKNSIKEKRLEVIKQWQKDFGIGITDTICQCSRRIANSFKDSDLLFNDSDLNYKLQDYVLRNVSKIEKIVFTSTEGTNSAFETFKAIMGDKINIIPQSKLAKDIVPPSNAVNTSLFNKPARNTLGLERGFFDYITTERPDLLPFYRERYSLKCKKKALPRDKQSEIELSHSEKGIVVEYKIWSYAKVLPKIHRE